MTYRGWLRESSKKTAALIKAGKAFEPSNQATRQALVKAIQKYDKFFKKGFKR